MKTTDNVARPDGYNSVEKLVSWARLGWASVPIYVFVAFCIVAACAEMTGLENTYNHAVQVVHAIRDYDLLQDWHNRWALEWSPMLAIPLAVASGMLMDQVGRFGVIFLATLLAIALLPLCWQSSSASMFITGYALGQYWLAPTMLWGAYLFCYEATPIKWRVPAVLGMALFETLGTMVASLANMYAGQATTVSGDFASEAAKEAALGKARSDNRYQYYFIAVLIALGVSLVTSLLVRKDSCISLVARGKGDQAYDRLEERGAETTSEPVPMTRTEFIVNASRENEAAPGFFDIVKNSIWPLSLLALVLLAINISDRDVMTIYYYLALDHLGEGYAMNEVPGTLVRHAAGMTGLLFALGMWLWMKDIRFMPAIGMFLTALGALICSTVTAVRPSGYPYSLQEISSIETVMTGFVMTYLGLPVLTACARLLIFDLFTNKCRGTGVFCMQAVNLVMITVTGTAFTEIRGESAFVVSCAAVIAAIAGIVFAAFYITRWFDHSIVCRDPETDACWLVSDAKLSPVQSTAGSSTRPLVVSS